MFVICNCFYNCCGIAYQKISKTVKSYLLCGFQVSILVPHTRMLCWAGIRLWPEAYVQLRNVASSLPTGRLWSSCVVLPLLALTWMSAVLAMTDKRLHPVQILFAVFDSLQGFVIVMVHCILEERWERSFLQGVRNDTWKSIFHVNK